MRKVNGKDGCLEHEQDYKELLDCGCYKDMQGGIDSTIRNAKGENTSVKEYLKDQVRFYTGKDSSTITPTIAHDLLKYDN